MNEARDATPVRRLGTWAGMSMVVSEVVGVGIFLTPATMSRALGDPWAAVLVWGAIVVLSVAGALCYAELATRMPRAGGAYVFLREGFGLRWAFVYGWMVLLVIDPGLTAVLAVGMASYVLEALRGSPALVVPVAIGCIAGFGLLTLSGLRASTRIIEWTAGIKLVVIAALVVAGLVHAAGESRLVPAAAIPMPRPGPDALATALVAAFFAFGGWWELGRMSEEVKRPHQTIPRALFGGLAVVAVIYVSVTVAFMLVMRSPSPATDEAFVRAVGATLFGEAAARVLPALVAIAVSGTLAAVLLRAPRAYLAMARDGVFPQRLARFDVRRGTCPRCTLLQVTLASSLVMVSTFDQILGYFVPTTLFFVGLAAAAVVRLPRGDAAPIAFRMPWYPLPLVVFLVAVAGMLALAAMGRPRPTLLGALFVVMGAVLHRFVVERRPAGVPDPAAVGTVEYQGATAE